MPEPDLTPEEELPPAVREALQELRKPGLADGDRQELMQLVDEVASKKSLRVAFATPPKPAPPPAEYVPQGPPRPRRLNLPPRFTPPGMEDETPTVIYPWEPKPGETPGQTAQRNDEGYSRALTQARRDGKPIARYPEGVHGFEKLRATVEPYIETAIDAVDKGVYAGVPGIISEQFDRLIGGEGRPIAENWRNPEDGQAADLPGLGTGGNVLEIGGMLMPFSAINRVMAPVVKGMGAAEKGARIGTRLKAAAATSALGEGLSSGVDAVGRALRGDEQRPIGDIADDVGAAAVMGPALVPPLEGLAAIANKWVKGTRGATDIGELLNNAELGGAETTVLGGLEPPPALRTAMKTQSAGRQMPGDVALNPEQRPLGRSAQDVVDDEAAQALHGTVGRYRDQVPKEIAATKAGYLEQPEVKDARISAQPIVRMLAQRAIKKIGDDGRAIPASELAADEKALNAFLASDVEGREFSVRNIEDMIANYRTDVGLGAKRASRTDTEYAVLRELYKLRDSYPKAPGYGQLAPPDAESPKGKFYESPAKMFAEQQDRMADLENVLETVKLPKGTDDVGADQRKQYEAMFQVAKTFRKAGMPDYEASEAFRALLAGDTQTAEKLVAAAAGRDYQDIARELGNPFRVIVGQGGTAKAYGVLTAMGTRARLALDNLAQGVAGVNRTRTPPDQLGGQVSSLRSSLSALDPDTHVPRGRQEPGPGRAVSRAARVAPGVAEHGDELREDLEWLYNAVTGQERRKRKEARR